MNQPSPPRWMERALLYLLPWRDREAISGDLLEEYRAEKLPRLGSMRANLWYLRQAISFASYRTLGGPYMKQVLTLCCVFAVAAGVWLAVMENILKHPGYFERSLVALCIVIQALATLLFFAIRGRSVFRFAISASAVGIILLGVTAVTKDLKAQHFEGFVLLIGAALVVQGLLTLLVLLQAGEVNGPQQMVAGSSKRI